MQCIHSCCAYKFCVQMLDLRCVCNHPAVFSLIILRISIGIPYCFEAEPNVLCGIAVNAQYYYILL